MWLSCHMLWQSFHCCFVTCADIGAIAGGAIAAVVAAAALAACALWFCLRRRKAKDSAELRKQASAYSSWHDGIDGDEMQVRSDKRCLSLLLTAPFPFVWSASMSGVCTRGSAHCCLCASHHLCRAILRICTLSISRSVRPTLL